jgi:DNA-directed RNA polymerase subunit L
LFLAKKTKKEKDEFDDNIPEDFFGDSEIESHYPKVKKEEKPKPYPIGDEEGEDYGDLAEGSMEFEEEEETPEAPSYKYLNLTIVQTENTNDYTVRVEGQSHGFLNVFVKHLLEVEGVKAAAYKVTQIDPPEIFIRTEDGYKIKDLLRKGIDALKKEVLEVENVFAKLM